MNYLRAILSGIILWICVAATFFIMEHIPALKDSTSVQTLIICILIPVYSIIGASFYYKNSKNTSKGIKIGLIMSLTAILMDILLFVPFVEIPKGNTYQDFFSNPLLWFLAILNITTVYFNWKTRFKIK